MNTQDKPTFASMMTVLGEYYGKEVSNGLITLYWSGLEQYDIAALRDALNRHMQNPDTGQFMPKIADIAKMIGGTSQDAALQAWAKVDRAIRQVGTYADVVFDDPLIHRVIHDMGGWIGLGQKTEDEWPFVAKEFENRYRGFRLRSDRPEYPSVLIGIANMHNGRHGYRPEQMRLIGQEQKCIAVLENGTNKPLLGMVSMSDVSTGLRVIEHKKTA